MHATCRTNDVARRSSYAMYWLATVNDGKERLRSRGARQLLEAVRADGGASAKARETARDALNRL